MKNYYTTCYRYLLNLAQNSSRKCRSLNLGPNRYVDAVWENEIEKRIEEVETGAVELIPEEKVFDEIRQRLKK